LLSVLVGAGRVDASTSGSVERFLQANPACRAGREVEESLGYRERAALPGTHPLAARLFTLMEEQTSNELLELADAVGPLVCALKTHVDVLCDFSPAVSVRLGEPTEVKDPTARSAHHTKKEPPGVVEALRVVGKPLGHGCLLIAQMSSQGCLATAEYTQTVVRLPRFCVFSSSSKISSKPKHVHMTPGVQLRSGGDGLGQQYTSPVEVICSKRSDVIIVGRGILASPDRLKAAEEYRVAGWETYLRRLSAPR
uniref:Orotidine 5'-phosphate decarboxylase domain-containing protein n=1 Tax=Electrophorus electricus TaxID=8005 RepID=A0A4W4F9B7_ELEEL